MLFTNFAAGELSPMLNGRTDIQQYYQGVSRLENFLVIPTGGIQRRVGSQRVAALSGPGRLIPFIINKDLSFIMELVSVQDKTIIYIWENGKKRVTELGEAVTMEGPWKSLNEIRQVQYAQNYDTMILVQDGHKPQIIKYNFGQDTFSFGSMSFDFNPTIELDDDYNFIPIEKELPQSKNETGYVLCNGFLYVWDSTTSSWIIDPSTQEYEIDPDLFNSEGNYPGAVAFFNGRLFFGGTGKARQKVWGSAAPNVKGTRYNDFSTYVKYITVNKVIKDPDIHFFTADAEEGADSLINVTQDLTHIKDLEDYYVSGEIITEGTKIKKITWDPDLKTGTIKLSLPVMAAGSRKVCSIQKWINRLNPSASDYEFKVVNSNRTSADNSFNFEIASDQNDAIKWLATSSMLVIGSESATYVMDANSSAINQNVIINGRYGTDDIQATVIDNAVLFFSNGNRAVREYYWNQDNNSFSSNDLAIMDPSILLESAAVDFDFMTNPYARVIITREDGAIVTLLYNRALGLKAWGRTIMGSGQVMSVAVVRGDKGCDIIYMAVKDNGSYYLERLDLDNKIYLDGWQPYTQDIAAKYNGNAVLFNVTTDTICSITEIPGDFISSGDLVYIGYPYISRLVSMPIVTNEPMGKKRIVKLTCRLYNSYKPELIVDKKTEVFTDFNEPYSGIKEIDYPGQHERDVYFELRIESPRECNILSIGVLTT